MMSKRKIICDVQLSSNPKHYKLTENNVNLLDGIEFMDFDEEFTISEGTSGKIKTNSIDINLDFIK